MAKNKRPDPLQIQIALKIKAPKGAKIHPRVLQQIIDKAVNGETLPPNVEFRGIFWRNPARSGSLSHWRYHEGADLNYAPTSAPVESTPRGSLRDAVQTLGGALYAGTISF
jgi:hypothetical protein